MALKNVMALIFLALILPSVAATASCDNIHINADSVRVYPDTTATARFVIDNRSSEYFYIDSTQVLDNSQGIIASENGFTREVNAFSYGTVNVRVRALPDAEEDTYMGTVQVRGHFQGGRECTFSQIGSEDFTIVVEEIEQSQTALRFTARAACPGVVITDPVGGWKTDDYTIIRIDNYSNFPATIRLQAPGATFNPQTIHVPYGSTAVEKVTISGTAEGLLYYTIDTPLCSGVKRSTFTTSTNTGIVGTLPVNPTVTAIQPLSDRVDMQLAIAENNGRFTLQVELENVSNESVTGTVSFRTPPNWTVEGNTQVTLAGNETRTRSFTVIPPRIEPGNHEITVTYTVEDEISEKVVISVETTGGNTGGDSTNNPLTGLFALGTGNAFLNIPVWVLLLVVIVLLWLFVQGRKRVELDRHHRVLHRP